MLQQYYQNMLYYLFGSYQHNMYLYFELPLYDFLLFLDLLNCNYDTLLRLFFTYILIYFDVVLGRKMDFLYMFAVDMEEPYLYICMLYLD